MLRCHIHHKVARPLLVDSSRIISYYSANDDNLDAIIMTILITSNDEIIQSPFLTHL